MAKTNYIIVGVLTGQPVVDNYGSVVMCGSKKEAEECMLHGGLCVHKPIPLVKWNKPRVKKSSKNITKGN